MGISRRNQNWFGLAGWVNDVKIMKLVGSAIILISVPAFSNPKLPEILSFGIL